jgi:tetratricopeptide (TPR) repeat protein
MDLWDLPGALEAVNEAARLEPTLPAVYSNAGLILSKMGHHDQACTAAQRAIELNPNSAGLYVNLAVCCIGARHPKLAEKACLDALRLDPHSSTALNNLALSYQMRMRFLSAYRSYAAAIRVNPQNDLPKRNIWRMLTRTTTARISFGIAIVAALYTLALAPVALAFAVYGGIILPHTVLPGAPLAIRIAIWVAETGVFIVVLVLARRAAKRIFRLDPVLTGVIRTQRPRLR